MEEKTSYGQTICRRFIAEHLDAKFTENFRPEWLFGMELDFFFPDHNTAIEFNGDQHYFPTALSLDPLGQIKRDGLKKKICKGRGIKLISITAAELIECKFRKMMKSYVSLRQKRKTASRVLNQEAVNYRELLKRKFGSPTAYKKGAASRQRAKEVLKAKYSQPLQQSA